MCRPQRDAAHQVEQHDRSHRQPFAITTTAYASSDAPPIAPLRSARSAGREKFSMVTDACGRIDRIVPFMPFIPSLWPVTTPGDRTFRSPHQRAPKFAQGGAPPRLVLSVCRGAGSEEDIKTRMYGRANNVGAVRACKGFYVIDLLRCDRSEQPLNASGREDHNEAGEIRLDYTKHGGCPCRR